MDPNLPKTDQSSTPNGQTETSTPPVTIEQDPAAPVNTTPPQVPVVKPSKKTLIIGGVILFLLISIVAGIFSAFSNKANDNNTNVTVSKTPDDGIQPIKVTPKPTNQNSVNRLLIYGVWTGQTSSIKAVNLDTSKTTPLAALPIQVRKINVLSPQTLLYIDQTDANGYGKRVTVYNIKDKTTTFNIPAAAGYIIADYVISPDKKYIAMWEESFSPGTAILQGGKSRVYTVDLSRPLIQNLVYDEDTIATSQIHYPRAILNDGTVFCDTILPTDTNTKANWAYGMTSVDFDGTNKQVIDSMQSGSYATQPTLSSDTKYLLFSGYDGSNGDGNVPKNGVRQVLTTPNTVDLVNTQTLQRFTLPNLSKSDRYTASSWDDESGNVILTIPSSDGRTSSRYIYDLAARTNSEIQLPANNIPYGFLSQLKKDTLLIGIQDTNPSNLGNLGDISAYAYTQFALYNTTSQKTEFVSLEDTYAQYITLLPGNYFKSILGTN